MAIDVEANLHDVSDVTGVNWSAVDYLEASGFLERVSGEAVFGGEGVVNESEPRSTAVDQ